MGVFLTTGAILAMQSGYCEELACIPCDVTCLLPWVLTFLLCLFIACAFAFSFSKSKSEGDPELPKIRAPIQDALKDAQIEASNWDNPLAAALVERTRASIVKILDDNKF